MSHQAVSWALLQPVKPTSAKHLLTVLAHYVSATKTGPWVAFPSVSQLAQDTGQDRKTIMMNMKRLIEQGCIVDTGEREGGTKSVPVYMLTGYQSSTEVGTSSEPQSSTNPPTTKSHEAVPKQGHLSSTNSGTPCREGSSTNPPPKQYQSTPEAVPIHPTEQVEQVEQGKEETTTTPPPRAHVHTPAYTREAASSSADCIPDQAQRRNVQVSVLIWRNGGCPSTHPDSKGIDGLVSIEATDVEILTALETAKRQRHASGSAQPVIAAYLLPIVNSQRAAQQKPATGGRFAEDIRQMQALSAWADEEIRKAQGQPSPSSEIDMGAVNATRHEV